MKIALWLLVSCAALAYAVPVIPETFYAKVQILVNGTSGNGTGSGVWAADESTQMSIEDYTFDNDDFNSFSLNRYDLGKLFRVFSYNQSACQVFQTKTEMPSTWGWLEQTRLVSNESFNGELVEVWESTVGYATRRIAISSANNSIPVWLYKQGTEKTTLIQFASFSSDTPSETIFAIPSKCKTPSPAPAMKLGGCMDSPTILSNAEVWVDNHVPYDQQGTYMDYRTDCSGYVSYTWQAGAPGLDTADFYQQAFPITQAELQPGDCMLNAGDHVVLFGGWVDDNQTYYMAYEETQPCSDNPNWCGTLKHSCLYPYYYDGSNFLPYRFNNFCGTSSATGASSSMSSSSSASSYTGSVLSRSFTRGGHGSLPSNSLRSKAEEFNF